MIGCGLNDRWILQGYDEQNGYTFLHHGVEYKTECNWKGPTPDSKTLPSGTLVLDQRECEEVLKYLHKSVPHMRSDGGLLVYREDDGNSMEFEIKSAK